ncbi:hypothetical protein K431DRAFT_259979 [Polychaeton citri CBS 116435]|uniref:Uncharacterized protein n=1 Tax=Polychaeton citri CBS 116435 TaxID=1314669 RepID=A0A9P4QFC9_9PEZI|nr:hypothetical protein K431DRAFT_259979 [Polychaeton citri CBS 116435]
MSISDTVTKLQYIIDCTIAVSRDKVNNYLRELRYHCRKAAAETPAHMQEASKVIKSSIEELRGLGKDHSDLCRASFAYSDEHQNLLTGLINATTSIRSDSHWGMVQHYIGRLGMWHRKAVVLMCFERKYPHIIEGASCELLQLPSPVNYPEPDGKTNVWSALGRMLPANRQNERASIHERLLSLEFIEVEKKFAKQYSDRKLTLSVHAETYLADHFHLHKMKFVERVKYIGCSKASCYCCSLYLRHHPICWVDRPCHGNLWPRWSPPSMPVDGEMDEVKAKHNLSVLNRMIADIRTEFLGQIEERIPRRQFKPDSSTAGSLRLPENNFS